jgi:HEAT repeat protein
MLGRLRDSSACDALGKVLTEDPEPKIRQRAVRALQYIGGEKAKKIIAEGLKNQQDGKVIRTILGAFPQQYAGLESTVEDIARNDAIEDGARRLAIIRVAKLGEKEKATLLAQQYFGENFDENRGKEHNILEVIDEKAAAELAKKIVNSSRAPEYKLRVINYLPSKIDAVLVSNVAGVLRYFVNNLKYAQSKGQYPSRKTRIGKELVAKCLGITDSPEIIELCRSIESVISELDERFRSEPGGPKAV